MLGCDLLAYRFWTQQCWVSGCSRWFVVISETHLIRHARLPCCFRQFFIQVSIKLHCPIVSKRTQLHCGSSFTQLYCGFILAICFSVHILMSSLNLESRRRRSTRRRDRRSPKKCIAVFYICMHCSSTCFKVAVI